MTEAKKSRQWIWMVVGIVAACALTFILCLWGTSLLMGLSAGTELGFGDAVAIVYVEGPIVVGREEVGLFGVEAAYSETIVERLRRAEGNSAVKAIVLRVESPGGSVVASDEIYQEIVKAKGKGKPVVVSMGELAASGGYYISAPADHIVANPATLTGSIGVIAMAPNIEELMGKIGVDVVVIKSGALKDELSPFREMTEEEHQLWQKIIDEAYGQFVTVVAEGRGLDEEKVRELADGRVYTGRQALELGLVDELGNLPEAVEAAARLGGIVDRPRLIEYRRTPTLFSALMSSFAGRSQMVDLEKFLGLKRRFSVQYLYL
ncbi:MAG: signal peptide peptidase SppA, partial [Anaerolineae bacterium]